MTDPVEQAKRILRETPSEAQQIQAQLRFIHEFMRLATALAKTRQALLNMQDILTRMRVQEHYNKFGRYVRY